MKNGVNSRPCASGCRATPEISALPATPSPIPAPIAPPAIISPPPMRAPAAIVGSIFLILLDNSGSDLVMVLFELHGLAEVQDRQQRENECLDRADEQVERFPDRIRQPHDVR